MRSYKELVFKKQFNKKGDDDEFDLLLFMNFGG
jgi:hypothetical protein